MKMQIPGESDSVGLMWDSLNIDLCILQVVFRIYFQSQWSKICENSLKWNHYFEKVMRKFWLISLKAWISRFRGRNLTTDNIEATKPLHDGLKKCPNISWRNECSWIKVHKTGLISAVLLPSESDRREFLNHFYWVS